MKRIKNKNLEEKILEEKIRERERLDLMFYGLVRSRDLIKKEIEEEIAEERQKLTK